ncbi:MAG TPA: TlpA disulfide reductase family protein [Phycisphaerae bacterium]|nr:TlpA disulfide reductase family protein [Phycisphaerae bacterium]
MPVCRSALCLTLSLAAAAGSSARPAAKKAPPAPLVPKEIVQEIGLAFMAQPKKQVTEAEYYQFLAQQMEKVLLLGQRTEAAYPKAENLFVVRLHMLKAADFLARYRKSDPDRERVLAISRRILASDAPQEAKITPDYFLTLEMVRPTALGAPKNAEKEVRAFVTRYAETSEKVAAIARGVQLAKEAAQFKLAEDLLDVLEKDHAFVPTINVLLRRHGRRPPFLADLTLLDGKGLSLPGDRKGKVVVVDFWATWSEPCLAALPRLKEVHAKYKDQGVEFVSISLDKPGQKDKLVEFVKSNGLTWPQAYSGKYMEDPTAVQYGVRSLPSVWVIGKDGRIYSDMARFQLERTLQSALGQPETRPKPRK